jgi:hypothetical protein
MYSTLGLRKTLCESGTSSSAPTNGSSAFGPAGPRPEPTQRKLRIRTTSRLSFPAETTSRRLSGSQRTANTFEDESWVT